jgi:hypothetical protein
VKKRDFIMPDLSAIKKIKAETTTNDNPEAAALNKDILLLKTKINELISTNGKLINLIEETFLSQKEETNILWWSYNGFCSTLENSFSSFSKKDLSLIIVKELSDLTLIFPGPPSVEGILLKALSDSKGDSEQTISELINSANKQWKEKIIKGINENYISVHTPLILAIKESILTDDPSDWQSYLIKKTSLDTKKKFPILQICKQFYNELLFVKLMDQSANE